MKYMTFLISVFLTYAACVPFNLILCFNKYMYLWCSNISRIKLVVLKYYRTKNVREKGRDLTQSVLT